MNTITVQTIVNVPVEQAWDFWNDPKHIVGWAFASDEWEAPAAENDLRVGGTFKTVMAARDGSAKFDFGGIYSEVEQNKSIKYTLDDSRKVSIEFEAVPEGTRITETFDPESENPAEMQRAGWQAIMDNFKKYAEKI